MTVGPTVLSRVEEHYIAESGFEPVYPPDEKIRTVVVDSFPELGRLTALRFLEWVQSHPGGVVSLPTGKTPEHFIACVTRYIAGWDKPDVQQEMRSRGLEPGTRPDMRSLHFVQMDEFFPLDSRRHNSFCNYVRHFYIAGFGLDPAKALVVDCNQIGLSASAADVSAWCDRYERRIRALGGIGFFLGGIGPDGHIAFNIRGSAHDSTTRLLETNYETRAAAAGDLGGIEVANRTPVITIGLGTITANPDCVVVIMAAGAAKANIVTDAIMNAPSPDAPGTALHKLPGAAFYLTRGAAVRLPRHTMAILDREPVLQEADAIRLTIDLALRLRKSISALGKKDFEADPLARTVSRGGMDPRSVRDAAIRSIENAVTRGLEERPRCRFLHTEPHHDDIMLGYLPALMHHMRDRTTSHAFATLTSGFTAVTNELLRARTLAALALAETGDPHHEDRPPDETDLALFAKACVSGDTALAAKAAAMRFLTDTRQVFGSTTPTCTVSHLHGLIDYLATAYPGQKDPPHIQRLKGAIREWEAETLWTLLGTPAERIRHLRLGFYKGDLFTEEPTESRDVPPIVDLLATTTPDIVTVALDPEASGPDTHYKVLQATAAAIRQCREKSLPCPSRVWGYRNVWYRFHACEANMVVPVSRDELAQMERLFAGTFVSQKDAAFPSHEFEGPFSGLARRIQVDQFRDMQSCLGPGWFAAHRDERVRNAAGLVFLREMDIPEFLAQCRELRRATEATSGDCRP